MNQFEEWTDEEDLLLAEIVLRHIRENSTMLNAFDEAGQKLNRNTAACGYRWNSVIRHFYINAIAFAKKQREVILMRVDERRKKWRHEENELHERIGSIKGKIQSITDEALHSYGEGVIFLEKELKEAQELINKLYKHLGTSADLDFKLWKEAETYCKEKKLI